MYRHIDLGIDPAQRSKQLHRLIRHGLVTLGGNRRLKIYGALSCSSGKRMKKENRVFFTTEQEAIQAGYRPCGHCMREKYKRHKQLMNKEPYF